MAPNVDEQLGLRLQDEHRALVQLGQVLKTHIAAQPAANIGPWLDGLRVAFERLHAHLARCINMKEQGGYLDAVTQTRPNLSRQVDVSKSEHNQLQRLGYSLRNDLAAIKPGDNVLIADACERVLRYINVVAQHEQRENLIVLLAFNQDIGEY